MFKYVQKEGLYMTKTRFVCLKWFKYVEKIRFKYVEKDGLYISKGKA